MPSVMAIIGKPSRCGSLVFSSGAIVSMGRCGATHRIIAHMPAAPRTPPNSDFRPASIFPSFDQMGLPATSPVSAPVATATA
jgi:hypothetical protein